MAKTYAELAELGRLRFQELTRELKALIVAFPDLASGPIARAEKPAKRVGRKRGYTLSADSRERMRVAQQARHARARLAKVNGSDGAPVSAEQIDPAPDEALR